jgi:hypothetical protein
VGQTGGRMKHASGWEIGGPAASDGASLGAHTWRTDRSWPEQGEQRDSDAIGKPVGVRPRVEHDAVDELGTRFRTALRQRLDVPGCATRTRRTSTERDAGVGRSASAPEIHASSNH